MLIANFRKAHYRVFKRENFILYFSYKNCIKLYIEEKVSVLYLSRLCFNLIFFIGINSCYREKMIDPTEIIIIFDTTILFRSNMKMTVIICIYKIITTNIIVELNKKNAFLLISFYIEL